MYISQHRDERRRERELPRSLLAASASFINQRAYPGGPYGELRRKISNVVAGQNPSRALTSCRQKNQYLSRQMSAIGGGIIMLKIAYSALRMRISRLKSKAQAQKLRHHQISAQTEDNIIKIKPHAKIPEVNHLEPRTGLRHQARLAIKRSSNCILDNLALSGKAHHIFQHTAK